MKGLGQKQTQKRCTPSRLDFTSQNWADYRDIARHGWPGLSPTSTLKPFLF